MTFRFTDVMMAEPMKIDVIDSHTAGEPTRVVVAGGPELGHGSLKDRRERFRTSFDRFRSAIINEPRGSDAVVGALLCPPQDPACAAGVIFFNNAGYIGMCGHGTIGVVTTLAHLGRVSPGTMRIETPVGTVAATLHASGAVTLRNVASYRSSKDVVVGVSGLGKIRGDVAWGGNWFFLVENSPYDLDLKNLNKLTEYAWRIRQALSEQNITGSESQEIDHIEISGPSRREDAQSRNFVLCPGGAYDRSPCGTGTSAKLACLYADGKFEPGQTWRQESITGSVFDGQIEIVDEQIYPLITGTAYLTAEAHLLLDERDPFCWGIPGGVQG